MSGLWRWPATEATRRWAAAAEVAARGIDPAPLRHGGTWFVGVDALPTAPDGSIAGHPLQGPWDEVTGPMPPLHPAQLSIIYPGYPGQDPGESDASHAFRRRRDGAHVDGLLPEGPDRRRHLREPHAFVLGVALTSCRASPLVVWEDSHEVMRDAFLSELAWRAPMDWPEADLTETYQAARKEVFETCERVEVSLERGEAVLVHRLAVHGIAPWPEGQGGAPRMMAYFRPQLADIADWLRAP